MKNEGKVSKYGAISGPYLNIFHAVLSFKMKDLIILARLLNILHTLFSHNVQKILAASITQTVKKKDSSPLR